jgi:hypothetical protein
MTKIYFTGYGTNGGRAENLMGAAKAKRRIENAADKRAACGAINREWDEKRCDEFDGCWICTRRVHIK